VPEDFEILVEMTPGAKQDWFTELKDGDCFDLGGYTLETIACGGHSPGSVAFLEREHQLLFSGDTIGSGNFWMQVPTALPMAQFRDNVVRLTKKVEGLNDLLVYPGHRNQSPVQLTAQYVQDTCFIAEGIMDGSIVGDDQEMNFMGTQMKYKTVAHGQMVSFCYDPDRLQ
ncbi:MAG: MBL fold metallo-hydrolase, partial [Lachnospiraceae bacterium]|nr:MBL fold metallo-hydrolase [Lachnospiraceae bacterium]